MAPAKRNGAALLALGAADKRVIGLDADVKNSTFAEFLYKKIPAQFLECRIAEQNMFSVAAGAAAAGRFRSARRSRNSWCAGTTRWRWRSTAGRISRSPARMRA